MKILLIATLLLTGPVVSAQNGAKSAATSAPRSNSFESYKKELGEMAQRFRDKTLSKEAKVKMLPRSNEILAEISLMKLSGAKKLEQIQTVVQFISASIEADFANSNTDTVYFDFKANKNAYLAEINKLSEPVRGEILEAFQDWEQFEKDAQKPESESADD